MRESITVPHAVTGAHSARGTSPRRAAPGRAPHRPLAARGEARRALGTALAFLLAAVVLFPAPGPAFAEEPPPKTDGNPKTGAEQGGRGDARRRGRGQESPPDAERKRRRAQRRERLSASEQRERWARLSPEKRRQLRAIYGQLKQLPAEKRELLLERLRRLDSETRRQKLRAARERVEKRRDVGREDWLDRQFRQTRRRLLEDLPKNVLRRLERLPREERRKHLQRYVAARREKLIARLPPDLAEEVRRLPPGRQAARLKEYRTRQQLRRTFRDEEELRRLQELPPRDLRRLLASGVERGTAPRKPDYLSERTWRRWQALKRYERSRLLRWIRSRGADPRSLRKGPERRERGQAGPRNATPRPDVKARRARKDIPNGAGATEVRTGTRRRGEQRSRDER